jgi:hypothetical protein
MAHGAPRTVPRYRRVSCGPAGADVCEAAQQPRTAAVGGPARPDHRHRPGGRRLPARPQPQRAHHAQRAGSSPGRTACRRRARRRSALPEPAAPDGRRDRRTPQPGLAAMWTMAERVVSSGRRPGDAVRPLSEEFVVPAAPVALGAGQYLLRPASRPGASGPAFGAQRVMHFPPVPAPPAVTHFYGSSALLVP